jgi:hypothetical protein
MAVTMFLGPAGVGKDTGDTETELRMARVIGRIGSGDWLHRHRSSKGSGLPQHSEFDLGPQSIILNSVYQGISEGMMGGTHSRGRGRGSGRR